jgi:hypothetical protein
MPLLYDESTPYRETPAERARRLLNQPSTNRAVPRSQLPAWVQQALREQDAATRPRAASPPVPTSRASLQPGELLLEPRSRDGQLRAILDSPVQGKAPGVASWSRPTRREVSAPGSYDADPYFDDQVRQDEQAAAFDRPSAYRAQRDEQRLWEPVLNDPTGEAGAYEAIREQQRRTEEWNTARRRDPSLEPLPRPEESEPQLLPDQMLGVPVTVDRRATHIAYRIRSGFGANAAERDYLNRLPEDERERVEALADELWLGAQAWEFGRSSFGGPTPRPRWKDSWRVFELATGESPPIVRDELKTIARFLLATRDGRDIAGYATAPGRNGTILVYTPAFTSQEQWDRLAEILGGDFRDERDRYDAVSAEFPVLTRYEPDRAGVGTALREWGAENGPIGHLLSDAFGKGTSPWTWMGGLSGAGSVVPSVIASNLYEAARELGLPPEVALLGTTGIESELPAGDPRLRSYKAALWAYARDRIGSRLDAYGDEWLLLPPAVSGATDSEASQEPADPSPYREPEWRRGEMHGHGRERGWR